ncbi:MAG: copper chaperone PCu(A)C [Rhizobiales bacterium]|nr:copper chaperone PCu(A)C [Hyphomicrobiales bacterium]
MRLVKEFAIATALTIAAGLSIASGHAHEVKIGDLEIIHPWSRQPLPAARVGAGFFVIANEGKTDDRLIKATAAISDNVQIHEMAMEDGVMKMKELTGGLVIPAGSTVELKPGSYHIMFMDLKERPVEGTAFEGTLTFEKAGTVSVTYEVEAPDAGMN